MLIDGRKIAEDIYSDLQIRVKRLPRAPLFCDILVGDDAVQDSYVRIKGRQAERIGIEFSKIQMPSTVSTQEVIDRIIELNTTPRLCGLIVQLPLPAVFDTTAILNAINPRIDVDAIGSENTERFFNGQPLFIPPTAAAIMHIVDVLGIDVSKKQFLVMGQGPLVGKPVTHLLRQRGLSVEVADKFTTGIPALLQNADIVISGTGRPGIIRGDGLKPGVVVIDAGTAEVDGGIVGDVDFASVAPIASFLSPVPGGVGPVTVAKLLTNVVTVAETHGPHN